MQIVGDLGVYKRSVAMLKTDEFGPRKMWLGSEEDHLLLFQRT